MAGGGRNGRGEDLAAAVVEIIALNGGIHHNELARRLKDRGYASVGTVHREVKRLREYGVVEAFPDGNRDRYRIRGGPGPGANDAKLAALAGRLRGLIARMEEAGPEYDQDHREGAYRTLEDAASKCEWFLGSHEESIRGKPEYEILLGDALGYSKYRDRPLRSAVREARGLHRRVEGAKRRKARHVRAILGAPRGEDLRPDCEGVISCSRTISDADHDMYELVKHLDRLKAAHQRRVVAKTLLRMARDPGGALRHVRRAREKLLKSGYPAGLLDEGVGELERMGEPAPAEGLARAVAATGQATEEELRFLLRDMEAGRELEFSKDRKSVFRGRNALWGR